MDYAGSRSHRTDDDIGEANVVLLRMRMTMNRLRIGYWMMALLTTACTLVGLGMMTYIGAEMMGYVPASMSSVHRKESPIVIALIALGIITFDVFGIGVMMTYSSLLAALREQFDIVTAAKDRAMTGTDG